MLTCIDNSMAFLEKFRYRPIRAADYVDIENSEPASEKLTDEEIIGVVNGESIEEELGDDESADRIDSIDPKLVLSEITIILDKIRSYLESTNVWSVEVLEKMEFLKEKIMETKIVNKQQRLDKFLVEK